MGSGVIFRGHRLALVALALALPLRVDAHRLDEYLQATRVSVASDAIRLELDLSPGVAIADAVIRAIDTDGDGRLSDREADAYAARVLRDVTVSVDGRVLAFQLTTRAVPSTEDVRAGVGTIRLTAVAHVTVAAGHHRLALANTPRPVDSVYLVNALVPSDPRIALGAQRRDALQRTYALDYDVARNRAWMGWSSAALAMLGLLAIGRSKRRGHDRRRSR